ncbi:hypothetical protein PV328_008738 [Microctonus aethiopoides]|uniref:RNA helicase n=1 Tax=Microctonus aethiopoides TaxID=144406 RepID=A0AA39FJW9_9HYME|nr:hypothetical protein PV328_008738 [Microctonus aethiopoides]
MGDEWNNQPVKQRYDKNESSGRRNYDNQSHRSNGNNSRNNSYQTREWTNSNRDYRGHDSRSDDGSYKDNDSLVIHVSQKHVGKIIGRGGCKIKELQSESGAKINIDKSGYGDAAITLIGTVDAQHKAKDLIESLTDDGNSNNYQSAPSSESRYDNYNTQQQSSYSSSSSRYDNYSRNSSEPAHDNFQQSQAAALPSQPKNEERDVLDFGDFDWTKANNDHQKFQKERWEKLKPLKKQFYNEDPAIAQMSDEQVAEIRHSKNKIECRRVFESDDESKNKFVVPNPVLTFDQAFHDYPEILEEIRKQGFVEPSPIQCQAWPILLSGKDMIGIAQTGTGKTLAFLLPALIHIDGQFTPREARVGPNVLIMAPTRELALQIHREVQKYEYRGIKAVCIYGGGNRKEQIDCVGKGVNIVIATPGRLNDLVSADKLNVSEVSYLVLDEADRMLDMGFEPQIRKALIDVRPDRQTVMTSATWPQGVRRLAQSYMSDPIQIYVGSLDLAAVHTVRQTILFVDDEEKTATLRDFFHNMGEDDKVIVFFGKKSRVDDLASELALDGINAQSIHGGREQLDREQALEDLKTGDVKILLATDVASRGIDIEDVTHVFNYDFPRDIEEYVHRVGRTGRAGRSGESISLVTRSDWALAKELIAILEEASQEIPQELYDMAERYNGWKERKAQEKDMMRMDSGGRSGGGGGHYGGRGGRRGRGGGRGRGGFGSGGFY